MVVRHASKRTHGYAGLRLSADEYLALPRDGNRYELIDGVVLRSPSPANWHQRVALEILLQLAGYIQANKLGEIFHEADVVLAVTENGRDLVYRPELHYVRRERAIGIEERTRVVPDLVVEVISPDSRGRDEETKLRDYERAGVAEYWLIDPLEETMTFFRLQRGRYHKAPFSADSYESAVVAGFRLDLSKVRAAFERSASGSNFRST